MPDMADYEQAIRQYDREGLLSLWNQLLSDTTPDLWTAGMAFEYLIIRAFEVEGAEVRYPYSVEIGEEEVEQIDGVVYADGLSCLIESKDWATRVNFEPIAKLRNQLLRRPSSSIGLVFSRSGFTDPAVTLAQFLSPQTILLWDGDEIQYALEHQRMRLGLTVKYRASIERGITYYNLRTEDLL